MLGQAMAAVAWKLETNLYITRKNGVKLHLTEGEDGLFDHMLRADLRQPVWLRDTRMYKRREFDGIRKGVVFEATVKPMRGRFKPEKNKAGVWPIRSEKEADGIKEQIARYKMSPDQRAVFRTMLNGSLAVCARLRGARL